ncbi:MAG: hypothetical protein M3N54_02140 [Acidobacteriota bacterium]|nr:hypothetical protein [Acidobacteriota bacterium]
MNRLPALSLLLVSGVALHAQSLLDAGYRQMYNLRFDQAHATFALYQRDHPADPIGPASDAAAWLFSEFERLNILRSEFALRDDSFFSSSKRPAADPTARNRFEAALAKTQQLAQPGLQKSPPDADAMFATVIRLGLHADYLALIEKRELSALSEIKQAREQAEKLLTAQPAYYDAYIAVALENYLLSLKIAPVRWILHATGSRTDRQTGLEKLRLTAERGHYLAPYARLLGSVAALRDHDIARARSGLQWLAKEYPGNPLYREELAKLH